MIGVEKYLKQEKPDLAFIYGDTNSTLAAAVAASKLNIKLAHVEAGLRSFNRKMPEEINRIIADRLSNLLFCPTTTAVENLQKEGIADGVFNIGDVMFDAARRFAPIAERASTILNDLSLAPGEFILLTLHRAENTDDKQNMTNIISALFNSPKQIVFPVHPRTEKCLQLYDLYEQIKKSRHISLIEPVSYIDMIVLEKNAQKILTDSGGVQKEAYFYQVPCITLREETEWVETVSAGWNCLVGANYEKIMEAVENFAPSSPAKDFYGDGTASLKLSRILDEFKHS
jgi:UDP-N-acetylglucosamine 2-epimerase (non-hydrolysing)